MKEPLNSFAKRIVRNGEVTEFIHGLVDMGVDPEQIKKALEPEPCAQKPKLICPWCRR